MIPRDLVQERQKFLSGINLRHVGRVELKLTIEQFQSTFELVNVVVDCEFRDSSTDRTESRYQQSDQDADNRDDDQQFN